MNSKQEIVADVVSHVPQEISRFVYFFLHHGGSIDATVEDKKYRCSPIAKGGLEIVRPHSRQQAVSSSSS